MNGEQIGGLVRTGAAAVLGYFAGKGLLVGVDVPAVAGALGVLAVAVWSVVSKKKPA